MTKSQYEDRETVGTIALKALEVDENLIVGDLAHELMPSLVDDLNNTIRSNPYYDLPFYITVHEKKDAQLKNVLLRRMVTSIKRPYPEPCTIVFWTNPKTQETLFCWSLPHWSVFDNYLLNPHVFEKEQIQDIIAYQKENLEHFGFKDCGLTKEKKPIIQAIPNFKDRKLPNSSPGTIIRQNKILLY